MPEIPTSNLLGKPVESVDLPTEWLGCFDVAMTTADAVHRIKQISVAVEAIGAKVVDIKFGNVLKHHGKFINNRLSNKCLFKLSKKNEGESVISDEQLHSLGKFLAGKRVRYA